MDNTGIDFTRLSVMDALDLAVLIEQEAEERYVAFAEMIGSRYEGDAAAFFQTMSGYEAKHGEKLHERRTKLFADTPMRVNKEMVESVEAPDYGTPRPFMSTRHALEVALDSVKEKRKLFMCRRWQSLRIPKFRNFSKNFAIRKLNIKRWFSSKSPRLPETWTRMWPQRTWIPQNCKRPV